MYPHRQTHKHACMHTHVYARARTCASVFADTLSTYVFREVNYTHFTLKDIIICKTCFQRICKLISNAIHFWS